MKKKSEGGSDTTLKTSIPVSESTIRNTYMVGKYSNLRSLPRLNVSILDSHSFVSIRQCILQLFGSGKIPENSSHSHVDRIVNISDSKVCKDFYKRAYLANPNVPK